MDHSPKQHTPANRPPSVGALQDRRKVNFDETVIHDLRIIRLQNSERSVPERVRSDMQRRRAKRIATIQRKQNQDRRLQTSAADRILKAKVQEKLLDLTGMRDEIDRSMAVRKNTLQQIMASREIEELPNYLEPPTSGGTNASNSDDYKMWWAESHLILPSTTELVCYFDDVGAHIAGTLEQDSGDLRKVNVGLLAHFWLDASRIPASTPARISSAPFIDAIGTVRGHTAGMFLNYEDYWALCWLESHQRLYTSVTADSSSSKVGFNGGNSSTPILHMIEKDSIESQQLPGTIFAPPLIAGLTNLDRTQGIQVDLEINLNLQIEGNGSFIELGRADPSDSVLIRTYEWNLEPIPD